MRFWQGLAVAGVIGLRTCGAEGATASLTPSKDNTLFESTVGDISNGAGSSLYVGRAGIAGGNGARRALLAFDLSSIPAGSVVTDVTLKMTVTKVSPSAPAAPTMLHRLTADWGEGASNSFDPGGAGALAQTPDATWLHRFYSTTPWTTNGGDFAASSAAKSLAGEGDYTWDSTAALVADVQGWLNAPGSNFGWAVLGDEGTSGIARRLASREATNEATRPTLTVTYTVPEPGTLTALAMAGMLAMARRRRRSAR